MNKNIRKWLKNGIKWEMTQKINWNLYKKKNIMTKCDI